MYFASGTQSMQGHVTSAPSVGNALPPMYHGEDQETKCYKDALDSWIQMAEPTVQKRRNTFARYTIAGADIPRLLLDNDHVFCGDGTMGFALWHYRIARLFLEAVD